MTIHYHGTPITPRPVLESLAGRSFCVSYAAPGDVRRCHEIGESVMLDNGAYTYWRLGRNISWADYMDWAEEWLDYPTTWAVIPDVIDGTEEQNDALLVAWFQRRLPKGAPVWHLHESLERLRRLAHGYSRVCFGSSGSYAAPGSVAWRRRVSDAFDAISDPSGRVPWVHMLRGMKFAGDEFPFASLDSADVARNHNRPQNIAAEQAADWDALQCPPRWHPVPQLLLEGTH